MKLRAIKKNKRFTLLLGLLAGLIITTALRFAFIKNDAVHYHANFALYVNGVRDEFKGPGYYEEVQTCSANDKENPRARVHMHNEENHIVHIHDHAVTWGDFFSSLGYTLGDKVLATSQGVFSTDLAASKKLTFVLNGAQVDGISGRLIGNEDVLLVDFGNSDAAALQKEYNAIPRDAHQENLEKDPSSCGGASAHWSFLDRLKKSLEFWQ